MGTRQSIYAWHDVTLYEAALPRLGFPAAASGTVSDLKTTTAVSGTEMVKILTKAAALAKKFRPAGK